MKTELKRRVAQCNSMFALVATILFLAAASPGQDLANAPVAPEPSVPRISSTLLDAGKAIPKGRQTALAAIDMEVFARRGMTIREDGKVFVEIIGSPDRVLANDINLSALKALGMEVGRMDTNATLSAHSVKISLNALPHRAEAWLPIGAVEEVSALLPDGYFVKVVLPPCEDAVAGEGPDVTNSDTYRDAGHNGAGLTIAVVDGGYDNLSEAQANGDAPSSYTAINYTPYTFESGTRTHGTGCVEAAFDHCPGATWRIYKIDSITDLPTVVNNCIANGVDIITYSQSRYNQGWADNTGDACSAANNASNHGILFFTSAGNRAESHFQGTFTDTDGDHWHEFSSGDETINLTISPSADGPYYLAWSNSGSDFDFYLYNEDKTTIVASSVNSGNGVFEEFSYDNPGATATFKLAVKHKSGSTSSILEIFSHNAGTWDEHAVAEGSSTSPSNATGTRVLSVGAVTQSLYGQPNGSAVISSYSSRGPSNSGMMLPDLCGPTDTSEFTYVTFGGTSSATPNAAGAACAFWSADTGLNGTGIRWLVIEQADLWRDWGSSGNDNTYGKGGLRLADYDYGTRWVARSYPGTVDNGTVPFQTVAAAHAAVPNGGRLFIFGSSYGTFPETATLGDTGKSIAVEVVPDTSGALMGQ